MIRAGALAALGLLTAACGDSTGVDDGAGVTVGFSLAASTDLSAPALLSGGADGEVVLTGANGTLTLTDVAFIVGEFKLEGESAVCGDGDEGDDDVVEDDDDGDEAEDDDDCEEFETELYFVELPLTGGITTVVSQEVPAGTYTGLKLEVEDNALDEDDDDGALIADVIADIEAAGYTEWPEDASLVVAGTFTPTGGAPRPFVAFFDAEIKVELELDPPLVIEGESGTIDIQIDPSAWFVDGDGVIDLSAFDFAETGEVLEFEAKFEDGFTKIELEGFDD